MTADIKPVAVDKTIAAWAANQLYGDRYGVDWIWHDDEVGFLHPQSAIDSLRAEVEELQAFKAAMIESMGNAQLAEFIEKHGDPVPLVARAERAEAEVAKLREALATIANHDAAFRPGWKHWSELAWAALGGEGERG